MNEQEAFEEWFQKEQQGSRIGSRLSSLAWHAALAWLRSQAEPVAWRVVTREGKTRCILEREPLREQFDLGETFVPLFLAPQPAIPDGWKLVPVEPTPEQESIIRSLPEYLGPNDAKRAYKNLLAAAPEPRK